MFGNRPRTINRAALIVRPKQPYVDWANSVDDDGPRAILQRLRTDPSIYLVETIDYLEDFDLLVEDTWEWCIGPAIVAPDLNSISADRTTENHDE